jgi:hypothetical protein
VNVTAISSLWNWNKLFKKVLSFLFCRKFQKVRMLQYYLLYDWPVILNVLG